MVHAEVANEFRCKQVGIEAVERVADVRGLANDEVSRQELADGAGVDIAVRVAGIARGNVVGVDSAEVLQAVLFAQAQENLDSLQYPSGFAASEPFPYRRN